MREEPWHCKAAGEPPGSAEIPQPLSYSTFQLTLFTG